MLFTSPAFSIHIHHLLRPLDPPRILRPGPKFSILVRSFSPPPYQSMDTTPSDPQAPKQVVVCGGGIIGVCTAYFLSKKGASVTLIEKSSIACAASGKAGGFLALDWSDGGPLSSLSRTSFNLHRSLAAELDGPQSYGYRSLTTLSLTVDESSSPLPQYKTKSKLPSWVDGPVSRPTIIGTTDTTAQVHPQLFTKTLLKKAVEDYGVKVVIGKLEKVEVVQGRATAVVLENGDVVEADAVVLALGPWTSKLGILGSIFRVSGLKAHSIVIQPKEPQAITPYALFLSYIPSGGGRQLDPEVYPRPTGEVYICGMSAESEVPDDPEQIAPAPSSIEALKRVAANVSSHLIEGEANVKAEQACFLPCTADGQLIIGEVPGVKGCYVATGHSCWGILNGPATGASLAELVLDGQADVVDLNQFSPARFAN